MVREGLVIAVDLSRDGSLQVGSTTKRYILFKGRGKKNRADRRAGREGWPEVAICDVM